MIRLSQLMITANPPSLPVACDNQRSYSWGEFYQAVVRMQTLLSATTAARWMLYADDSYEFAVGLMALLHSGKTILLPPNAQSGTLMELSAQCDAVLGLEVAGIHSVAIDTVSSSEGFSEEGEESLKSLVAEQCYIEVVTSGSTGQAQIIRKTLSSFELEIESQYQMWQGPVDGCIFMATVSHQHIYGLLFRLLLPLCCRLPFWRTSHQYPEPLFADMLKSSRQVVLVSSPAHLARLPANIDYPFVRQGLNIIFSSGGPLALDSAVAIRQLLGEAPVEVFGSTETGGVAWRRQHRPDDPWRALPGVSLRAEEEGLLQVKSPYCFADDWYTMGDKVEFTGDGIFTLKGRADRVVKLEEKRLSLTQMELRLTASALVDQAHVLVLPGRRQQLAAVITLTPSGRQLLTSNGKRAVNEALKQTLLAYFERVLMPRKWRYPASLPVNSQGKLPLSALANLFQGDA